MTAASIRGWDRKGAILIRFPDRPKIRGGASAALPAGLRALACAFVIIVSFYLKSNACPDARDIGFLQGLNRDREYSLAAFQAELYRRSADCPPQAEIDLELGKALYQLGGFARARTVLAPHLALPDPRYRRYYFESRLLEPDPRGPDSALAQLASAAMPEDERGMFTAAALFLKDDIAGARAAWPAQSGDAEGCPQSGKPRCYLDQGFKSPAAAAWLSLAPGAGYAYAGRSGDGLFAFTVVSLFYGVAAYYAHYGSPARAWTFAGFGAVFHASNVYGAQRAARESNKRRKLGFLMALHERLFR